MQHRNLFPEGLSRPLFHYRKRLATIRSNQSKELHSQNIPKGNKTDFKNPNLALIAPNRYKKSPISFNVLTQRCTDIN